MGEFRVCPFASEDVRKRTAQWIVADYCGSEEPDAAEVGVEAGLGDAGFATGAGLFDVGGTGVDLGESGIVVIALSGLSR